MNDFDWGNDKLLKESRQYLLDQIAIIMSNHSLVKSSNTRFKNMYAFYMSITQSASSIAFLSQKYDSYYSEMTILSRPYFEKILNIIYMAFVTQNEFDDLLDHTVFRNLWTRYENKKVVGNSKNPLTAFSTQANNKDEILALIKELGLDRFIIKNKKGEIVQRKTTNFPVPSINQRLATIMKKSKYVNVKILLLYQHLHYDNASESIHGSMYGSFYPIINEKLSSVEELNVHIKKNTILLLIHTGQLLTEVMKAFYEIGGSKKIVQKCEKSSQKIADMLKVQIDLGKAYRNRKTNNE